MISEVDLKDWEMSSTAVKLYDVPRSSFVSPVFNPELCINFSHIDGMYSFCTLLGTQDVIHLGASTDVFVWRKRL